MTNWETYRAEDYCLTVTDGTHDSPKPQAEGRYLITSKHLKPSGIDFSSANKICEEDYQKIIQRSKVEQYDILFSMIGTVGNIHRVTIPIVDFAVKNMGIFKMGGDANKSLWMYYWLQSPIAQEYIQSRITGSTQGYLTLGNLRDFPVCVPPLEEQRRIAGILGAIDDKIENNRRINTNLELQAQALYKQWFVDNRSDDWTETSLSELMEYQGGSQPPASEFIDTPQEGYVRFIQIRDYASNSHPTYIPISKKNKLCQKKDIMIARYGASLGRICFGLEGAYNVALAKVKPINECYREFLRCYLSSNDFYEGINMKGNRAVQAGFNQSDINSFVLKLPKDCKLFEAFEKICSKIFDKRLLLIQENETLATLRDTLLPKLMNGEIKL